MKRKSLLLFMTFILGLPWMAMAQSGTKATADLTINSLSDWNTFRNNVNNGTTYSGQTVLLNVDLTVTNVVGTITGGTTYGTAIGSAFSGTFDGNGKTITLDNITAEADEWALFRNINGATIRNLKVDGQINTSHKLAAGIVANCHGNNTIENCVSDVTINSTCSGDSAHGGIVGRVRGGSGSQNSEGTTTLRGCAFTGKLLGTNSTHCGGIVGWCDGHSSQTYNYIRMYECVFAPSERTIGTSNSRTLSRVRDDNASYYTFLNCFYTETFGNEQGQKLQYTISGANNVTVELHDSHNYSVSGITGYYNVDSNKAIIYNGNIYSASGNSVSLDLSCTGISNPVYSASNNGSISGSSNPYTLTMPNSNTVISASSQSSYSISLVVYPYNNSTSQPGIGSATLSTSTSAALQTITVNTSPASNYKVLSVYTSNGDEITTVTANSKYTFVMPDSNVTVYVLFAPVWSATTLNASNTSWTMDWSQITSGWSSNRRTFTVANDNGWAAAKTTSVSGSYSYSPRFWRGGENSNNRLSMKSASNKEVIAAFPEFTNDLNDFEVSFKCYPENKAVMEFGYYNCTDGSFTMLEQVTYSSSTSYANAQSYTYSINAGVVLPGNQYRLAFRYKRSDTESPYKNYNDDTSINFYDISVQLKQYTITATTADATIGTVSGSGTYYVGETATLTATANMGYIFQNWTKDGTVVSTNPTYSFTVSEAASYTATFTAVSAASIPFTDDFETDKGWTFVNGTLTNQWHRGTAEGGHNGGDYGLYISNDNGTTYAYSEGFNPAMVYAYQWFYFEAGDYSISYDWKCKGDHGWDFLRVALVPASYELVASQEKPSDFGTTSLPEGWIAADGGEQLSLMSTWTEQARYTITVANAGYYRLAFCWRNDYSGGYNPPAAIDNVAVRTANTFNNHGNWNDATKWSRGVVPTMDEDVIIRATCTVPSNCVAQANAITIGSGNITIAEGGQLQHGNEGLRATMEKNITAYTLSDGKDNYNLMALPFASAYTVANSPLATGTYDFYKFDGAQQGAEWRYGETSISNGEGFLYANTTGGTLNLTGKLEPIPSNGSKTIPLASIANTTYGAWNLIGNPFACNTTPSINDYYVIDGEALAPASGAIVPLQGIFVQATENIRSVTFSKVTGAKNAQALNVCLTKAGTRGVSTGSTTANLIDRARVRFDEGEGLEKFQLNPNHTKVYIPQEGKDYAVVYADAMGTLPVNFKAESNGTYTLSFTTEEVSFAYLHLIDNMTGNDVDLLAGASTGSATYTFDARTTDYESRFKLVFVANDASTGSASDETFAFYSNGSFVINNPSTGSGSSEATLQVIDMNGRILKSESINGCANVNVKAAAGVYVLRLVNGNDVKVQKVVVR